MSTRSGFIKGLEWVETRVSNYEEMKVFFRKTLGLPLNFEEERKDFIQFKVGGSKTYLAILDSVKTAIPRSEGFVPTFEVSSLKRFAGLLRRRGVKVGDTVIEGDHVRLIDFYGPNGTVYQAFEWKRTARH